MANDETIRSFLVGLGWKNDTTSEKRFIGAIEGATLKANLLARGIEDMAERIGASLNSVSQQYNSIFRLGELTKTSGETILGLQYAFKQLGLGGDAANTMLLSVSHSLNKLNTSSKQYLSGNLPYYEKFGFEQNKITGQITYNVQKSIESVQSMSPAMIHIYAGLTDVNEDFLMFLKSNGTQIQGYLADNAEAMKDFGFTDATIAKQQKQFETMTRISNDFSLAWGSLTADLEAPLIPHLEAFDTWFRENEPRFETQLATMAESFAGLSGPISDAATAFKGMLSDASPGKLTDFTTDVGNVTTALKGWIDNVKWFMDEVDAAEKKSFEFGQDIRRSMGRPTWDKPLAPNEVHVPGVTTNLNYPPTPLTPGGPDADADNIIKENQSRPQPMEPAFGPKVPGNRWWNPFSWRGTEPHLARGGIVDQPTHALIGERGPEAVLPLDSFEGTSFTIKQGGTPVQPGNPLAVRIEKIDPNAAGIGGGAGSGGLDAMGRFFGSGRQGLSNFLRGGKGAGLTGPCNYEASGAGNLTKLIDDVSKRAGIDPRIMEGIRAGESGHGKKYDTNFTGGDESYGPFQLNRKQPGALGSVFERETAAERKRLGLGGLEDPRTIEMQADWVAKYIKRTGNLSPWAGYHGNRDADPYWGDAGYNPTPAAPTVSSPLPSAAPTASAPQPSVKPKSTTVPKSNIRLPAFTPGGQTYPSPNETDGSGKPTGAYDPNRQRQSWRENAQHYADLMSQVHHHYDNSDNSVTHNQVANNTIHITGVSDPNEAASAVGSTLAQVFPASKSATRHLASALG